MLIVAIVFLLLFFSNDPYGRYTIRSWGFLVNATFMWFRHGVFRGRLPLLVLGDSHGIRRSDPCIRAALQDAQFAPIDRLFALNVGVRQAGSDDHWLDGYLFNSLNGSGPDWFAESQRNLFFVHCGICDLLESHVHTVRGKQSNKAFRATNHGRIG
jgi:hypothetical protein